MLINAVVSRDAIDASAARANLNAATERQKALAPVTAEYAREPWIMDLTNARLTLAG